MVQFYIDIGTNQCKNNFDKTVSKTALNQIYFKLFVKSIGFRGGGGRRRVMTIGHGEICQYIEEKD